MAKRTRLDRLGELGIIVAGIAVAAALFAAPTHAGSIDLTVEVTRSNNITTGSLPS